MIDATGPIAAGQVWRYQTRPHEQSSRLVISKVESDQQLIGIVHIQITGLRIKNPKSPIGFTHTIPHLPYEIITLRNNLLNLESNDGVIVPFEEGYHHWRTAFEAGKANVWTLSVADAIGAMEAMLNR